MTMDSKRHATFFLAAIVLPGRFPVHSSIIYSRGSGFGTGLNFLTLWLGRLTAFVLHPQATLQRLHFISFEKFPLTRDDRRWRATLAGLAPGQEQLQAQWPLPLSQGATACAGSGPGDAGFVVWRYCEF